MARTRKPAPGTVAIAPPFTARQCRDCGVWIFVAYGPFAEGDRTKTVADYLHYEAEHLSAEEAAKVAVGFPYMPWNEEPVEAVFEGRKYVAR